MYFSGESNRLVYFWTPLSPILGELPEHFTMGPFYQIHVLRQEWHECCGMAVTPFIYRVREPGGRDEHVCHNWVGWFFPIVVGPMYLPVNS